MSRAQKALPHHLTGPFEALWQALPHRPGDPKSAARLVFAEAAAKVDPALLVLAAGRYADQVRELGTPALYLPATRTWLRERRFEDFLQAEPEQPRVDRSVSQDPLVDRLVAAGAPRSEVAAFQDRFRIEEEGGQVRMVCASPWVRDQLSVRWAPVLARLFPGRRVAVIAKSFLLAAGLALGFCRPAAAECLPAELVRVVDGDTFVLRLGETDEKVRALGYDTPELHARCPEEATMAAAATQWAALLLESADTVEACPLRGGRRDRYGRLLASVLVDGRDLGDLLIRQGLARAYAGGRRGGWCR